MADPARRLELASIRLGARRAGKVTLKQTILFSLETLPEEARAAFYALGAFAPKPDHFIRAAAQAVAQTDAHTLALLVARNLLEKIQGPEDELALHQVLADLACPNLPPEALARHRDYYLALVNQDRQAWRQIEPAYGQIRWAWPKLPESEGVLDWVWALRVYQGRRGLWRDQIVWIGRGLRVTEPQGMRKDQGTLLNNMAAVYDDIGQRQKALELYEQVLPIRQEVGDRSGEATTLSNMALVYDNIGQRQKALELYGQALPIRKEVGDRSGEAATLGNMAVVYNGIGQRQKALELYEQALPIQREVGDRAGESVTCYNLAQIYWGQGHLEEAVAEMRRVVELDRQVGHRDLESDLSVLRKMEGELNIKAGKPG